MTSNFTIPQTQRAFVLDDPGANARLTLETAHPIEFSGVCHSDLSISEGLNPLVTKKRLVGGHEGVGIVVAISEHTTSTNVKVGDRVGVKFIADVCMDCEMCYQGADAQCLRKAKPLHGFTIDGTFQEYTVAYVRYLTPIPDALSSPEATAIMCAGVTMYRALRRSDAHVGDWVVIPGAGGGLGHLGVQYAVAMGLRVVAIDTGEDKRSLCHELGADAWIDFKESKDLVADVIAATDRRGPHAAIVTASTSVAYEQAIQYLGPLGTLVLVALPPKAVVQVPIVQAVAKSLTIRGSYVGDRKDALEAVALAAAGKVKVKHTVRGLSELPQVYEELRAGKIAGRVVLDISK